MRTFAEDRYASAKKQYYKAQQARNKYFDNMPCELPQDPWKIKVGMKWVGRAGWLKVTEVIESGYNEGEENPSFEVEIFDNRDCSKRTELVAIGDIQAYIRASNAKLSEATRKKESRVKPGNNGLEELDQVVLNYFAEALGDPIVKNTGSDPKSFTYTMRQRPLEKTYEVSLDGEYYDDVWIKLIKWDTGAQTSYVIAAGSEEDYWSGMSAEELQADLEDCFANVALPARHFHESRKIKESHVQGGCPVCGEKIWSDEGVADVVIDGKKVKVHEYHCTRESIEKRQAYCDRFWATHDSTGYNYYVSMKQFHPPICQLRNYNDDDEEDNE